MRRAARVPRRRAAWLALLAVACATGAAVQSQATRLHARWLTLRPSGTLRTALHDVEVRSLRLDLGGRDGGIAPLGDGLLVSDRDGRLWTVDEARVAQPLRTRIPVDAEGFRAHPANRGLDGIDQFGVKDIEVVTRGDRVRLLAAHNRFDPERECYGLRVSMLEVPAGALRDPRAPAAEGWRTVFDSRPCLPIGRQAGGPALRPTIGAGGRLALIGEDSLLVTVGAFRGEERIPEAAEYWDAANAYGKTWLVDLRTGAVSVFTIGHRNPQGLAVGRDGSVWLTEHAARGGDELNLLVRGRNYGFPVVTYGTAYGRLDWPPNPAPGRHEGFTRPRFAWVPSIGPSQVIEVSDRGFPAWRGDLLVGSLADRALHRLHLDAGRVVLTEVLPIGHRVRDLVQLRSGTIVVKSDADRLLFLSAQR